MCGASVWWSAICLMSLRWIRGASMMWSAKLLMDFGVHLWRQCDVECYFLAGISVNLKWMCVHLFWQEQGYVPSGAPQEHLRSSSGVPQELLELLLMRAKRQHMLPRCRPSRDRSPLCPPSRDPQVRPPVCSHACLSCCALYVAPQVADRRSPMGSAAVAYPLRPPERLQGV